jgi:hypothetical protein
VDLLFKHTQTKKERKSPASSVCDLKVFSDDDFLIYLGVFNLEYSRYGTKKRVTFEHGLNICLFNGDINVTYRIINDNLTDENVYKTSYKSKKNDFKMLNDLIDNGFYRGEKRLNYWGVKYERAINEISLIVTNKLKSNFKSEFYTNKSYKEKPSVNELYDIIVDFHLSQKNIKGHDNVYYDIMDTYPSKKYLKLNDNKFLPSVLDSFGIKSKFLIKELNTTEAPINLIALNYICKLFGENYLDYIKKINWKQHCCETRIPKIKSEELKNDVEKNSFVKLINNWNSTSINLESIFTGLNNILKLRKELESKGVMIVLNAKNDNQFNGLLERLISLKQYYQRGYKIKFNYSREFLEDIEEDIIHDGETFKVKVLVSEDDFINEGVFMKNCMAKQFNNGILYTFLRGSLKNKHINIQYRKGNVVQSYGKSNTPVSSIFLPFIDILNKKFSKYQDLTWIKEKYEFLNN